jgi:signal transduction histidine kinase
MVAIMTPIDHIVSASGRLGPGLIAANDLELMQSLDHFCRARELADMLPDIQKLVEQRTDFNIGYMMLRPECLFGNNFPGFIDTSVFDQNPGNPSFRINVREMGIELFAVVCDRNAKRARLNLGLILGPDSGSTTEKEFHTLCRAISEENDAPGKPGDSGHEYFLSKLIHQVRNPLATILISASQLAMKSGDCFDDDDRMLVDFINSESEKIAYFLSKYSAYALAGKAEFSEIDAPGLIRIVKDACSPDNQAPDGIALTISAGIANLQITLDPDQIACAVRELIDNAREAAGEKMVKITVSLRKEDKSVQIIICDDGPGIRPEMLRKVKEPFFSTKDGGSGLGLTIADKIIAVHGGTISVDSLPDKGTRFTISLPCK